MPTSRYSMLRMGLAPCSPFTVTNDLMKEAATLARKYQGVRLHTHLAENQVGQAILKAGIPIYTNHFNPCKRSLDQRFFKQICSHTGVIYLDVLGKEFCQSLHQAPQYRALRHQFELTLPMRLQEDIDYSLKTYGVRPGDYIK